MKKVFFALLSYLSLVSCDLDGDLSLGNGYYYIIDPAFNKITYHYPEGPTPFVLIEQIEKLGYNDSLIYIVSKLTKNNYRIIDKRIKIPDLEYDRAQLPWIGITKPLDSVYFFTKLERDEVFLKSKYIFQMKNGF